MGERRLQIWLNDDTQQERTLYSERKQSSTARQSRAIGGTRAISHLLRKYQKAVILVVGLVVVFLLFHLLSGDDYQIPSSSVCLPHLEERYGVCVACPKYNGTKSSDEKVLIMNLQGRVGNQLFQYSSLIGVAHKTGKLAVLRSSATELLTTFPKLSVCVFKSTFLANAATHFFVSKCTDVDHCKYSQSNVDCVAGMTHVQMDGYMQSYRYFAEARSRLAQDLQFALPIQARVAQQLAAIRDSVLRSRRDHTTKRGKVILVGAHVRRGDIVNDPHFVSYGYLPATPEYFEHAAAYFLERYPTAHFVVCSDDYTYTKSVWPQRLTQVTHYCDQNNQPEEDLALLSSCDHSLISVGSYSFWSAYLRETKQMFATDRNLQNPIGETVYYARPFREGTELAKIFDLDDYYPSNWHALE